ncbi:MAG: hypothetical protein ACREPW_12605, partial [Candidatus Binataceae bacterium]
FAFNTSVKCGRDIMRSFAPVFTYFLPIPAIVSDAQCDTIVQGFLVVVSDGEIQRSARNAQWLGAPRKHQRQEVMNMRRALSLTVALLLAGGLSAPAFAQAEPQVTITHEMTNQDLDMAELRAFDQVATSNPKMARRLAANPHLANNDSFLRRWRDLNNFFAKYPGSKERFLEDPGNYLAEVHMHHLVRAPHKTKSTAAPEATPAEAASPAAEAPATPAAPATAASPAAPPSSP